MSGYILTKPVTLETNENNENNRLYVNSQINNNSKNNSIYIASDIDGCIKDGRINSYVTGGNIDSYVTGGNIIINNNKGNNNQIIPFEIIAKTTAIANEDYRSMVLNLSIELYKITAFNDQMNPDRTPAQYAQDAIDRAITFLNVAYNNSVTNTKPYKLKR